MSIKNYYLGCPVWAKKVWVGNFYESTAKPKEYLEQYASVLNTVEGNNTFYSLPYKEAVLQWKEMIPEDFQFCFKFPYSITHARQLNNVESLSEQFLSLLKPLQKQIGLLFLQLPPYFTANHLEKLDRYLTTLPKDYKYTVEARQTSFYTDAVIENEFNDLLESHSASRAIFDTRLLHAQQSEEKSVLEAQKKKPKMPEYFKAIGKKPFIRFVGHNGIEENRPRLNKIADTVSEWINEGRIPYVFMHTPNYKNSPELCRSFHQLLKERLPKVDLGTIPLFPAEKEARIPEQLSLFS